MELNSDIKFYVNLQLTEAEARAFYKLCTHNGVPADMKQPLTQLIKELPEHFERADNARKFLNNQLVTRNPTTEELFSKFPIDNPPPPPPNLNKVLRDSDISFRCYNCLSREKLLTLGDIAKKTPKQLLKLRNFGKGCLEEVRRILLANNIDWEKYMGKS